MKSPSSRKTYGLLPLSPAAIRGIQLEWEMVEQPAPRARFLNFPFVDDEAPVVTALSARPEKRAMAA